MSVDIQHAHQLLDQLGPGQLAVVVPLLEVMIRDEVDGLSEEDRRAVAASREYWRPSIATPRPWRDSQSRPKPSKLV